ncbi:MAG: hypothetical protein NVS3B18_00730 [Candidatus Dormibacteria bacterium]
MRHGRSDHPAVAYPSPRAAAPALAARAISHHMSTTITTSSSKGRIGRRVIAVGTVLVLVLLSCVAALNSAPRGVAVAGPQPVHLEQQPAEDNPSDDGSGGAQLLSEPLGPRATVPILVYHYVRIVTDRRDALGISLSVTPTLFAEQMALLEAQGGHPVTLAALISAMTNHTALPAHPVVITFDDGYDNFATVAEPILAAHGFVATDFVVSGFLNRPGFMTAAQVRQMDADGMVIGSHTVHHVNLARLPQPLARAEIEGGKATLEAILGHPVLDFAYPYGGFNPAMMQLVQQAGFREAVTTVGGDQQALGQRYALRRIHVGGFSQDLEFFATAVGLPRPDASQTAVAVAAAFRELGVQPAQQPPMPQPATSTPVPRTVTVPGRSRRRH